MLAQASTTELNPPYAMRFTSKGVVLGMFCISGSDISFLFTWSRSARATVQRARVET